MQTALLTSSVMVPLETNCTETMELLISYISHVFNNSKPKQAKIIFKYSVRTLKRTRFTDQLVDSVEGNNLCLA
jgi:hypothetical protein